MHACSSMPGTGGSGACLAPLDQGLPDLAAGAQATAISTEDIVKVMSDLGLIKYWKGDHIIRWIFHATILHAAG